MEKIYNNKDITNIQAMKTEILTKVDDYLVFQIKENLVGLSVKNIIKIIG